MADLWVPLGELDFRFVRSSAHWRVTEHFSSDGGKTGDNMAGTWAGLVSPDPDTTGTAITIDSTDAATGIVIYELTPSTLATLLGGQTRRELDYQVQLTRNSKVELIRWGKFEIVKGLA